MHTSLCCAAVSQAYLVLALEWGGTILCVLLQLEGLLGLAHCLHIISIILLLISRKDLVG